MTLCLIALNATILGESSSQTDAGPGGSAEA